jgi:hypothetical protein
MVLPKFIPICIFAASSTGVLLIPVASGALGVKLYEGYKLPVCVTVIRLACPWLDVTVITAVRVNPEPLIPDVNVIVAVPLPPLVLFICNQDVAGLETVHVPFVVSDISEVPPSGSKETSVAETVNCGSTSSFPQDIKVIAHKRTSNILAKKYLFIVHYFIVYKNIGSSAVEYCIHPLLQGHQVSAGLSPYNLPSPRR